MKKQLPTVILILVFLAGLSLLLYPTVSDYWNSFHASRAVAAYAQEVADLNGAEYDRLLEAFGRPAQATGFAVDVDAVAACLPDVPDPVVDTVIYYELSQLSRAIAEVDHRPDGTCELSPCASLELTLALAREKGIPHVLVLDSQGERTVEA